MVVLVCCNPAWAQWVQFTNETATRLNAIPANGSNDVEEKDYAWGDVDQDGDIDLVCVRKQPFTSAGKRTNVLYMNEGGVLTERTSQYATETDVPGDLGFNTATNDRDVLLVDLDMDGWLDIVTAVTISDGDPKAVGHPRIYRNKGSISSVWQGFRYEVNRIPTMLSLTGGNFNPRFCSVAAGDLNGDGAPELWFGDYDSSGAGGVAEPAGADFDDRLLMNNGSGFFTDITNGGGSHFSGTITVGGTPYPFQKSAFGAAAAIADMNGDGFKDIVKQTGLNPPQYVGIGYNKAANPGFFDTYQSVYTTAPYFVSVGDLNNDNRLDMVVSDDGTDRYLLNNGNNGQGLATFSTITFPTATNGFGSQSVIADLNNDGWKDVLISDVDVDIGPCGSRIADLLRNNGNGPSVTFVSDIANIPSSMLTGVHNFAVFDINGDGWLDMVVGRCSSTQVWINVPPTGLAFTYPQGLPSQVLPNVITHFQVQATAIGAAVLDEPTGAIWSRVNGGIWSSAPMTDLSNGLYDATLPATACASSIDFYVAADAVGGATFTGPPGAPSSFNSAVAAVGSDDTVEDFEIGAVGWSVVNDPSLTSGTWVRADPVGTLSGPAQAAPEDDAQAGTDKVFCFVTANGAVGGAAGAADVDGGPTHLISPAIDLAGTDATVSFSAWLFSSGGTADVLTVGVSNNNGTNWTSALTIPLTNSSWQSFSFRVGEIFPGQPLTSDVRVRFSASDNPNDSVTEAGIDVFQISKITCAAPCTCSSDLNSDGKRSGLDIDGFVACITGGGVNCSCGDLDATGSIDFADVTAFVNSILQGDDCVP